MTRQLSNGLKSDGRAADDEGMTYYAERQLDHSPTRERSVPCQSGRHGGRSPVKTFNRSALCDDCARALTADVLAPAVVAVADAVLDALLPAR